MLERPFKSPGPSTANPASASPFLGSVLSHSPGAAGLCRCPFSPRWDGSCWWRRRGRRIPPSWARRPGTPEEAGTRPAEAGSSSRADPPEEARTGTEQRVQHRDKNNHSPGWGETRRGVAGHREGFSGVESLVVPASDSVAVGRHQHTHTHVHTLSRSLTHTHPRTVRRMFQGSEHVRPKN